MKQSSLPYDLVYRHYNLPESFPIVGLLGSRWILPDDDLTFLHFHNCLEIGYCYNGTGSIVIEDQEYPFEMHDVTIIGNNTPHRSRSFKSTTTDWEYIYVDVKQILSDFLPNGLPNQELLLTNSPAFKHIFHKREYPHINILICHILSELRFEKENYQLAVKGLFLSLFIELIRIISEGADSSTIRSVNSYLPVMPAISYISDNYMKQVRMEYLAELCGLSPAQFRRVFHNSMHTNPLNYLNHIRIKKSCILLHNTEDSILDISMQVGFQNISSYNRHFLDIMKSSPLKWRNASRSIHKKDFKYSVFEF